MRAPPAPSPLHAMVAWSGGALFAASLLWFLYCYLVRFGRPAPGSPAEPLLIDIGLFTIFALHHSVFARERAKTAVREVLPPRLERSAYTWAASLLFLGVCTLWRPVPGVLYDVAAPWRWLGYLVQGAGLALTVRASAAIDVLDLAGVRQVRRAPGTPAHAPLETSGLYGFVRHPLYFAWVLLVFGAPTMTGTRAVFASVSTAYLALAIPFEERSLVDTFGAEYERYRRRVRWRMLPGLY